MTQGSKRTYSNVFDCASKIAQQEGYATFLQVGYLTLTHTFVAAVTPITSGSYSRYLCVHAPSIWVTRACLLGL